VNGERQFINATRFGEGAGRLLKVQGALFSVLLLVACRGSLSPLSNRLQVGQEPYVIFVADGESGAGDLFASGPGGGTVFQVTFTRVDERLPALSPDGTMLAFVRSLSPGSVARQVLVVMNLLNGAERQEELEAPFPDAIAWSVDGRDLYVRSGDVLFQTAAPPRSLGIALVPAEVRAAAESALSVLLGDPPLAEAVPCDGGGVCARFGDGTRQPITASGAEPARWMGDSIAYREERNWVIRPLAGGRPRTLRVSRDLGHLRSLTVFGGPRRASD
jgi:hypothetical protein